MEVTVGKEVVIYSVFSSVEIVRGEDKPVTLLDSIDEFLQRYKNWPDQKKCGRVRRDCPVCDKKGLKKLSNHLKQVHGIEDRKELLRKVKDETVEEDDTSEQDETSEEMVQNETSET